VPLPAACNLHRFLTPLAPVDADSEWHCTALRQQDLALLVPPSVNSAAAPRLATSARPSRSHAPVLLHVLAEQAAFGTARSPLTHNSSAVALAPVCSSKGYTTSFIRHFADRRRRPVPAPYAQDKQHEGSRACHRTAPRSTLRWVIRFIECSLGFNARIHGGTSSRPLSLRVSSDILCHTQHTVFTATSKLLLCCVHLVALRAHRNDVARRRVSQATYKRLCNSIIEPRAASSIKQGLLACLS
jgi:hypothetical protein